LSITRRWEQSYSKAWPIRFPCFVFGQPRHKLLQHALVTVALSPRATDLYEDCKAALDGKFYRNRIHLVDLSLCPVERTTPTRPRNRPELDLRLWRPRYQAASGVRRLMSSASLVSANTQRNASTVASVTYKDLMLYEALDRRVFICAVSTCVVGERWTRRAAPVVPTASRNLCPCRRESATFPAGVQT